MKSRYKYACTNKTGELTHFFKFLRTMKYRGKEYNTMGEVFDLALKLAKNDPNGEAKDFFYEYVNHISIINHYSWDKSIEIAKSNLGYFAGYYDRETYDIINKVYKAQHPVFGCNPFDVSPEDAFNKGMEIGLKLKSEKNEG